MIDKDAILKCIEEPMMDYHDQMVGAVGDWDPLIAVSEKMLEGEDAKDLDYPEAFQPVIDLMDVCIKYTRDSKWDWSNPEIQEVFKKLTESTFYRILAESTAKLVLSIASSAEIGTLLEVGTGPGQVSRMLCSEMVKHDVNVPLIVSDRAPTIAKTADSLRKAYPQLTIDDFIFDVASKPPAELVSKLKKPVLLYERFCIPYGGYEAIDTIAPLADIFIMVEDLNLEGKKEAYDVIMEKIGARFLTFKEAKECLEKHFSFIHTCDQSTIDAINLPVTDYTLAIK